MVVNRCSGGAMSGTTPTAGSIAEVEDGDWTTYVEYAASGSFGRYSGSFTATYTWTSQSIANANFKAYVKTAIGASGLVCSHSVSADVCVSGVWTNIYSNTSSSCQSSGTTYSQNTTTGWDNCTGFRVTVTATADGGSNGGGHDAEVKIRIYEMQANSAPQSYAGISD